MCPLYKGKVKGRKEYKPLLGFTYIEGKRTLRPDIKCTKSLIEAGIKIIGPTKSFYKKFSQYMYIMPRCTKVMHFPFRQWCRKGQMQCLSNFFTDK